jgi:hypothetical protein
MKTLIYFECGHSEIEGLGPWLLGFVEDLKKTQTEAVQVTDDPSEATHIVFLESGKRRLRFWQGNHLKYHPLVRKFSEKCFIWCSEDAPLTYLPGLYVSMPKNFFDPRVHRSFRYLTLNTERRPVPPARERDLLYCFVGAPTSKVRRKILSMQHPPDCLVEETLNYNHSQWAADDDVSPYAEILARSRFTLCPPGSGASSYRLFEAMRAGSIPVVISDQLVLADGPDWPQCSVRLPEAEVGNLESALRAIRNPQAMGEVARQAFVDYFAADRMLGHLARELRLLFPADQKRARRHYTWHHFRMAARRILGWVRRFAR